MSKPWYKEGLRFECTSCGKCCTGSPGYVWITESEMQKMASFLNLSLDDFAKKYVRQVGDKYSLIEDSQTFDCVFLKDNQCQVYGARPTQCRTFPFWRQNVSSKKNWEKCATECEGINPNAPLISVEEIKKRMHS